MVRRQKDISPLACVPGAGCSDSGVGGIIIIIIIIIIILIIIIRSRQESEVQIARPCALHKIGKGSATVAEERGAEGRVCFNMKSHVRESDSCHSTRFRPSAQT